MYNRDLLVFLEAVYYVVVCKLHCSIHKTSYAELVGDFVDFLGSFYGVLSNVSYGGQIFSLVIADFSWIKSLRWRWSTSNEKCDQVAATIAAIMYGEALLIFGSPFSHQLETFIFCKFSPMLSNLL